MLISLRDSEIKIVLEKNSCLRIQSILIFIRNVLENSLEKPCILELQTCKNLTP